MHGIGQRGRGLAALHIVVIVAGIDLRIGVQAEIGEHRQTTDDFRDQTE